MLLSHKSTISVTDTESNIIGHLCYAAYKLWNVCNYERRNYKSLNLPVDYPNWYYQKKAHKDDLWYKQLPSQTAQEVCKLLDKSWKSFYKLQEGHSELNPKPPRFKRGGIPVTYMQNGILIGAASGTARLSLPKKLKEYMSDTYGISADFLYLKNGLFKDINNIKQIKLYPPEKGKCEIIIVYEMEPVAPLPDNGRYLSIDIGCHNLMACFSSPAQESFIIGREYLSVCHYYNKEIARVQGQWYKQQDAKYPKSSKHIKRLYARKRNTINDYLHKCTRYIVDYCKRNKINTVIAGDLTGVRKNKDFGAAVNQQFHALPYKKIYTMLSYKLAKEGINFVKISEAYSSQVSPLKDFVCKRNAVKSNRVMRGLYKDSGFIWNADVVGAFNILRLYLQEEKIEIGLNPTSIKTPYVVKVAA